jgi:polyisoprenoid-binding protein YceI
MRRILLILGGLALIAILIVGAGWAYLTITGGSGEASQAISAPELEPAASSAAVYRIIPEASEVRFLIDEVLRGEPFTAVGVTNQVAGDIAVDLANPANTEVGTVRINVRTLETDAGNRNRALRSFILRSAEAEFEFAEFQPTELTGLPDSVTVGEPFDFQIVGDLTVTGVTNSVTFDATATLREDNRLTGQAAATVLYPDFNLTIPSAPFVASVEDEVRLEIDFVAEAVVE